jgi:acyl transferase domain-containing protein
VSCYSNYDNNQAHCDQINRSKDILHEGHPFNRMLLTLALQLHNFDQIIQEGIRPDALIGYCFGEYAASIVGGYMTEQEAVDVLARRSLALSESIRMRKENGTGKPGAMLNVFASSDVVRRHVFLLPEPEAEVAIHAGPSHTVLSGNIEVIARAQEHFRAANIRTVPVSTDTPFHSREMDVAIDILTRLTPGYPSFTRSKSTIQYISGITGRTLPSSGITIRYWARHMREQVRFLECMKSVRERFENDRLKLDDVVFLDVGPSGTLQKMILRYKWDGLVCEQSKVYLENTNCGSGTSRFDMPISNMRTTKTTKDTSSVLERPQTPTFPQFLKKTYTYSGSESRFLSPPTPIPMSHFPPLSKFKTLSLSET